MPLPGGLTTVTVTGTYLSVSGVAQSGSVSFVPTAVVTDAAGTTIFSEIPAVATLGTAGSFSLGPLPCTDNTGLSPLGWAYQVTVAVGGAQQSLSPVYLPHALGSTVDMSQLTPGGTTLIPSGLFYLPNAASQPSAPAQGGGFLFALNGALYWQGPSGGPTLIAPA